MGSVTANLEVFCSINEETARIVKKFLLGDASEDTTFERKNSASSSESEVKYCPDSEEAENVENWDEWADAETSFKEKDESDYNWLFQCDLKTYADAEYLLVSWESRFVALRKHPDEKYYKITCKKYVDGDPMSAEITCSCVFALNNSRHKDQIDCVILCFGTLDGHVYFYTENGTLIYFDRFSIYEPINGVHFECVKAAQCFLVVLSRTFFVVNPISLNAALHRAKSQVAKGERSVEEIRDEIELECDLFKPDVKDNIIHVMFTGIYTITYFEQYANASWESFNARVEKTYLPTYSTFMVTTEKEFVSFLWHDRQQPDQIWEDAVKLGKSFLPSFGVRKFFGISTEPARKPPHMKSAQHVPLRSQLLDERVAQTVSRSPTGDYVAITDRLARVVVIDIRQRCQVLLFKGYRDASVSWIGVMEEGKIAEKARLAQFLSIFAPRRSLLEVWTVMGGVRVHAQHVDSTECNLIYGGEAHTLCGPSINHTLQTSFFLDEKGTFHQVVVPFHLALHGKSVQNQHDDILLRKLEALSFNDDNYFQTFEALKIEKSRIVAFDRAIGMLKDTEEAHRVLARIRTISTAQSLGELLPNAEKSAAFYVRIIDECKGEKKELVTSECEMDGMVRRIVDCHIGRVNEKKIVKNNGMMGVGEWMTMVGLHEENDVFKGDWTDETRLQLANLIFSPLFIGNVDVDVYYDTVIEKIPMELTSFIKLLCLKYEQSEVVMDWNVFDRCVNFLSCFKKCSTETLQILDQCAMQSRNISSAIVLFAICWCVREKLKNQEKEEKEDEEEEMDKGNTSWDAISPEAEHLDSMLMCLHCVVIAQQLVNEEDENGQRVADVARRIDSYCRENLAKWIVEESLDAQFIEKLFPRDPAEELGEEMTSEEDRRNEMIVEISEDKVKAVENMSRIIPKCFEHDLVVADVCWQLMSTWFRNKETNFELITFQTCTRFLQKDLVDIRLRHGIAKLIWDKFIGPTFESLVMMVEAIGKMPKEREIMKNLGFGENRVIDFLKECEKFLDVLMATVKETPVTREFKRDLLIEMSYSSFAAHLQNGESATLQDQLSSIAIGQPLVNYHLVMHHYHLALALRLQLSAGVRLHPLKTLFCTIGNRAFFVKLDSHPLLPMADVDEGTVERRHAFLTKIAEKGTIVERRDSKILELDWNLTVHAINLMQALSSYRIGNDADGALELQSCSRDDRSAAALAKLIASRMLKLASERKTLLSNSNSEFLHQIAGNELTRVELFQQPAGERIKKAIPLNWFDSVISIGKSAAFFPQTTGMSRQYMRMNDIAKIYWGAHWIL